MFKIVTTVEVSKSKVQNLLASAFEGGCDWIEKCKTLRPESHNQADFEAGGKYFEPENQGGNLIYVYPFIDGYSLEIKADFDDRKFLLNTATIQTGLQLMAEKYPKHFQDIVNQDDDATTADIFLQLALFGEVVVS